MHHPPKNQTNTNSNSSNDNSNDNSKDNSKDNNSNNTLRNSDQLHDATTCPTDNRTKTLHATNCHTTALTSSCSRRS